MAAYLGKRQSIASKVPKLQGEERESFIKMHLDAIEEGNPRALNSLGNYYNYGEQNYELAEKYYKMGADLKYPGCIINLAEFYLKVKKDIDLMKQTYQIGIDLANTDCMCNLASFYKNSGDYDLMEKYYMMAYSYGNTSSVHQLALFYKYNQKDYNKMIKYFELGIEKDCSECMYGMGVYYEDIVKDYEVMKVYYDMAVQRKNPRAIFALGYYYERIENNMENAVKLYIEGSELDNDQCLISLAQYYKSNGKIESMIACYKKLVVITPNAEAYYELARYFLVKEKDTKLAIECTQRAHKLGFDSELVNKLIFAIIVLKNELEGKNIIEDIELGKDQSNESNNTNKSKSIEECKLGLKLFESVKIEEAKEHFILSAKLGNPDGLYYLGQKYYLEKKFNCEMMKKCMGLITNVDNGKPHKDACIALSNYYNYVDYNRVMVIKYILYSMGNNTMITFKDMTRNPYMYSTDDESCNYIIESNQIFKINMETGEKTLL